MFLCRRTLALSCAESLLFLFQFMLLITVAEFCHISCQYLLIWFSESSVLLLKSCQSVMEPPLDLCRPVES